LDIDLSKYDLKPIRAKTLARTSDLAFENKALAAINGSFFQTDGTPSNLLIIDKKVMGFQIKPRAALGWTKDRNTVLLDRLLFTRKDRVFQSATGASSHDQWQNVDFDVGGTPLLIQEYKVIDDYRAEKVLDSFLSRKHARTAICVKDKDHWTFVVVDEADGLGFTIPELAHFMAQRLKCRQAINLDGGSSTSLVIDGQLINDPYYGERMVSNAIGVFAR
jgi:exopolysaccharide biosynthesis protein